MLTIQSDRTFFAYLRGYMPESKTKELGLLDDGLANATLIINMSVVYPDGKSEGPRSYTTPFKTVSFNDYAHLTIRDARGTQVEYLPSSGRGDALLDFQIPTVFVRSGTWTFDVEARLGDEGNACVFAMSLTQWLDGAMR